MSLNFFCEIKEVNGNEVTIVLSKDNMNSIPVSNTTLRKIYFDNSLDVPKSGLIYVSDSKLETTDNVKKLTVLSYYSLIPIRPKLLYEVDKATVEPTYSRLSEEIKNMIIDSKYVPADIFK